MFQPVYNRVMAQNISVPDIGDFKDVEVIEILVKPGDQINKNDPIVTIESDKSSVEIPSPSAGLIKDLKVKIGDKVSEGDKIIEIESEKELKEIKKVVALPKNQLSKEVDKKENKETGDKIVKDSSTKTSASPKVRKFARELGIDINKVSGSERKGRVTESDVKLFVATKSNKGFQNQNTTDQKIEQEYSHSEFGEV